jgi:hypothetical protein
MDPVYLLQMNAGLNIEILNKLQNVHQQNKKTVEIFAERINQSDNQQKGEKMSAKKVTNL